MNDIIDPKIIAFSVFSALIAAVIAFLVGRKIRISKIRLPLVDFELFDLVNTDMFRYASVALSPNWRDSKGDWISKFHSVKNPNV